MTVIELAFAACTALAMVGGFLFEWRRQGAQDGRIAQIDDRCGVLEDRVSEIEAWRNRIGRAC